METGSYTKAGVAPSISPSMDIQVSSNFERALYYAYNQDAKAVADQMADLANGGFEISQGAINWLREQFQSGRASEEETMATIKATYLRTGQVICPHTAVGVKVANAFLGDVPMITLATAHPAKFPEAVHKATSQEAPLPERMQKQFEAEERVTRVAGDLDAIQTLIRERLAQ